MTAYQQRKASTALARHLLTLKAIRQAKHIGIYLASDGEISLEHFYKLTHHRHQFYIPKLCKRQPKQMRFNQYRASSCAYTNHYEIKEMSRGQIRPIRTLDVLLMPLVAFDKKGERLGMGGGFYDRALAYKKQGIHSGKPLLIGIGHQCQLADAIPTNSWDIDIDIMVTDKKIYHRFSC